MQMNKSAILATLRDQLESIDQNQTIRLNGLNANTNTTLNFNDVVDCIFEFIHSFDPPLVVEKLSLENNHFSELPSNFSKISPSLKYLDLHHNSISNIPNDYFHKYFKQLEVLDLSSNKLSMLPESVSELINLKVLSIKDNKFKYLSPTLGNLPHLNLIEVANNPLILPSNDMIRAFQKQKSDLDWVSELKSFLLANRAVLYQKIDEGILKESRRSYEEQSQQQQQQQLLGEQQPLPPYVTPPSIRRSQSVSEGTKAKSSKASRRMGLIIKKSDESNGSKIVNNTLDENSNVHTTLQFNPADFLTSGIPHSASAIETHFPSSPPQLKVQTSMEASSTGATPAAQSLNSVLNSPSHTTPKSALTPPSSVRPSRSRSNTLKEIDRILENSASVDTEHKSSAYFRRLSTLQEQPLDEFETSTTAASTATKEVSHPKIIPIPEKPSTESIKPSISLSQVPKNGLSAASSEGSSPVRTPSQKKQYSSTVIKVSRKVLFSFSELHSSIRRFTRFCSDKKITMKMVSFLYSTKANIDSLVENLEIMEEMGNNLDQIVTSLQTCISSFKSMMNLLHESFSTFVNKIDVCFIRMFYLSIYGSFNELHNAYMLLVPKQQQQLPPQTQAKLPSVSQLVSTSEATKPKIVSTPSAMPVENSEEMDEKLYITIETATATAQTSLVELNQALLKNVPGDIQPNVASRVKELTNLCTSSSEITKRLSTRLITIRNNPSQTTKKLFAEDINQFIKTMVQTLAAVKAIVKDLPILDDIRASMSNLTKTAKEVTYMLEVSAYKSLLPESSGGAGAVASSGATGTTNPPPPIQQVQSLVNSVPNVFTPGSVHPPTLASTISSNSIFSGGSGPTTVRTPMGPISNQSDGSNSVISPIGSMATTPSPLATVQPTKTGNPFDNMFMRADTSNNE